MQTTIVGPRTTTRALVDPSRKCSLRCSGCYYLPDDDLHTVQPWEQQKQHVLDAKARGCDCCDISGGEPLQNPHVVELVKFCVENDLPPRIITSLICPEKVFDAVLDAGVSDWLISMHGAKHETHDKIVAVPRARMFQERRLEKIMDRMDWCTNYVLYHANQTEMAEWAHWLLNLPRLPKVVNFINFNVFSSWFKSPEWRKRGLDNVVDIRIAGPILDEAIDLLEDAGIGVNVRYYPFCGLAESHWKNVANDRTVAFDFGEWDNAFGARTPVEVVYHTYSVPLSKRNEEQGAPCNTCDLHQCCGGANRLWHQLAKEKFDGSPLVPITLPEGPVDFWHYRGMNARGLYPRLA